MIETPPPPPPPSPGPDSRPNDDPTPGDRDGPPDDRDAQVSDRGGLPGDHDAPTSDLGAQPAHPAPETTARWEEPRPSAVASDEPRSGGSRREEPPAGERYTADEPNTDRPRHRVEVNLKSKSTWLRLVFIVLFAVVWAIAEIVLTAVVVVQFLWVLIDGAPNERLRAFGQSLARYAYQIFRYMTFNSDERPFPIDLDWPSGAADPTSS